MDGSRGSAVYELGSPGAHRMTRLGLSSFQLLNKGLGL